MSIFPRFRRRRAKPRATAASRREPRLIGDAEGGSNERTPRARKKTARRGRWFLYILRHWIWPVARRLLLPGIVALLAGIFWIYYDLPDISTIGEFRKSPSVTVKAADGTILGSYGDVYGDYVPYAQLPKPLINAVVATEDRNFFHHFGVDPWGLLRASWVNMRAHKLVQGGSTITQQVAKNVFLTPERKLKRKLQEMVLAVELERKFSKQQILTIYLNRVYMGAGTFGVDAASRRYFGHSVREVSLGEAAILVGLLKAPSRYAPISNPDLSERRATQVLLNMVAAGYLTGAQEKAAAAGFDDDDANYRDAHGFGSFYFSDYVVSTLPQYIGTTDKDVVVTTTLSPEWQHAAEDAVTQVMAKKGKAMRASQAAVVSLAPDGAIRAMVGGRNYRASQFNRVTQGIRQPGSSFKLFVYLAGLENGFLPSSEMEDKPINIGSWHPRDYTGKYRGMMSLRDAFAQSVNSIAVQLSEAVGRHKVIAMAERLGITSEMEADPSIALGTTETTLFDMTRAYAQVASGGVAVYPYAISKVESAEGKVLYLRSGDAGGQVLKPDTVQMMNGMLMAVVTGGTGRAAQIGRPVAGKTGTTSDYKDAWFIGFVPQLTTGVWVGNDDTAPMKKVSGGSLPASIWHDYMAVALKGVPVADIPSKTGGGFFGSLFDGGASPPSTSQPFPQTASPSPRQQQNKGGYPASAPDEEPTPAYNAPSSFWDSLR